MKNSKKLLALLIVAFLLSLQIARAQVTQLNEHILFFSSFDGKTTAEISMGDSLLYTAPNYSDTVIVSAGLNDPNVVLAKEAGLTGDALRFKEARTSAIFYKAYKNAAYNTEEWSGTVSFWLKLDPDKELAPGYCDPICITDMRYNDAALWVDFTDHDPRKFRFGAMGDLDIWNANNENDEEKWEQRTITVNKPPFNKDNWSHVALVFSKINTSKCTFELYINGKTQGIIKKVHDPFTWEENKGKIMLGLGYIGLIDDLAIFDKPLSPQEVNLVFTLENGIKSLFP